MAKTEPQSTFYNVMPEASGVKISSTRKVNADEADQIFGTAKNAPTVLSVPGRARGLLRSKKVLIPAAVVVVLGLVGFGLWRFLGSDEPEEQVVENITTEQPQAEADVTTPADWLARFFGSETCTIKTTCGDSADPDRDGFTNKEEFDGGTDPNNPDSDSDGLADGDEKHIFESDPLISRTFREGEYNDSDFAKGGYDIRSNTPYNETQLTTIKTRVKERGLHQPTLTTIGTVALSLYDFKDPNATALDNLNIDQSPQAKLDRDTQRQSTIKKIGGALLKYKADKKTYPKVSGFIEMSEAIASYNTVATNYNDPINAEKYVYGYEPVNNALDFTLAYFSETQNQLIKYSAKNAEETAAKENGQANDQQRINDLENIKSALMIYSSANVDSNSDKVNVFPTKDQYPYALIPRYITSVPKDPTGAEYVYASPDPFDTFTLRAVFQSPPSGVKGYVCTELECKNY